MSFTVLVGNMKVMVRGERAYVSSVILSYDAPVPLSLQPYRRGKLIYIYTIIII